VGQGAQLKDSLGILKNLRVIRISYLSCFTPLGLIHKAMFLKIAMKILIGAINFTSVVFNS